MRTDPPQLPPSPGASRLPCALAGHAEANVLTDHSFCLQTAPGHSAWFPWCSHWSKVLFFGCAAYIVKELMFAFHK